MQDITGENYVAAATSTECPYEGTAERLKKTNVLDFVRHQFVRSIEVGESQDKLKKYLFYGRLTMFDEIEEAKDSPASAVYARAKDARVLRLLHAAIGLQTEAAELQQQLFQHIFAGEDLDLVNVEEEVADYLWYCALAADVCGRSMTYLMKQNIAKLSKRYPDKFSTFHAENRDLEGERKILEADHR